MIPFSRSVRVAILLGLAATATVVALYVSSFRRLAAARDDAAERQLCGGRWLFGGLLAIAGPCRCRGAGGRATGSAAGGLAGRRGVAGHGRCAASPRRRSDSGSAWPKGNLATFQFNEARTYADAILERQPGHAYALWLRGRAWVRLQQEDKAREDFEQAVDREPEAFEIRLSLAELLHKLGYVREAIAHYERLRSGGRMMSASPSALAHCWQEQGQLDDARGLLDALLTGRPDSIAGLVERGRLALRMGQPEDGERWLQTRIELSPDNAEANCVLRLCLQAQEKSDAALERRIDENERTASGVSLEAARIGKGAGAVDRVWPLDHANGG